MNKCLLDSDFLIALFCSEDASHDKARKISEQDWFEKKYLVMTSLVKMEAATVMSKWRGMVMAREFVKFIDKLADEMLFVDEIMMERGWKMFLEQNKKGTSFVDCMNLVLAKRMKYEIILSFDKFYPKELRVK